jgi:hypothetical protein
MSAKPDYVVSTLTRPTGAATGGFVINLTSSTTPMALSQPKDPTLAQYTFFVSRRREDGRERFRLHMGYFETMQAAEEMLQVVREVYPSAWAGEAPGKKLRANNPATPAAATPAPQAPAPSAPPPPPVAAKPAPAPAPAVSVPAAAAKPAIAPALAVSAPAPAPAAATTPPAAANPAPHPFASTPPPVPTPKFEEPFVLADGDADFKPIDVPVVHPPAEVVRPAPQAAAPKPAPARPATKPVAAAKPPAAKPPAAKPAAAKPAAKAQPARPPAVAPKIAAQVSAPAALTASAPPAAKATPPAAKATPPATKAAPPAVQIPAPPVQAATPAPKAPPEPTVQMPAPQITMSATAAVNNVRQVIEELDDLSDTQTIRLLERHSPYKEGSQEASVDEAIRVVKPDDVQAMQAIKSDVKRNAPVLFAVQLDWSVSSFDMAKVPPLAIFNAYTLYTTEANREGRTWYGLRLGFFSDAVSAKQVAYYVRSDFKTVSVVPVTTIEKERATDLNADRSGIHRAANIKEGPAPTPASLSQSNASGVFKLLEDDTPMEIKQDVDGEMSPRFFKPADKPAAPAPSAGAATPAAPAADPKKAASNKRKPGAKGVRRDAHAKVDEETLDQTLEILGASTLEIQNDRSSDTGVRHLRVKIDKKGSKFASLIDRLSGKKPNPF